MDVKVLGNHERDQLGGATHLVIISHEDLTETTANTAQVLSPFTVADGDLVGCVGAKLIEDFQDASDAAFNTTAITSGDGGDADRFLTSMELNVNGTEIDTKAGVAGLYAYTTADTVDVTFNSMSAKSLSNLDAGEVHLYFTKVSVPSRAYT